MKIMKIIKIFMIIKKTYQKIYKKIYLKFKKYNRIIFKQKNLKSKINNKIMKKNKKNIILKLSKIKINANFYRQ